MKFQYSNAKQDDLWESMTEQANKDSTLDPSLTVKEIMDTWTLRKGYPVVYVERNQTANTLTFKQDWFLLNPLNTVRPDEKAEYKWYVPFTYTTKSKPDFNLTQNVTWIKPQDDFGTIILHNL
jgi:aminopeptidase N